MNWDSVLSTLTQAPGVSGSEMPAANAACALFAPFCDVTVDQNQSVHAALRADVPADAPLLVMDAHLDEVGLVVTGIDENGFLSFAAVGGIAGRHLPAYEVCVHGREDVYGVITSTPPHLAKKGDVPTDFSHLRIDTGMTREQLGDRIALGSFVTFRVPTQRLANEHRIVSKALDDRGCCAILLRVAELLHGQKLGCRVVFTLTSGEETTSRGSSTSAFALAPDQALVLDVTYAKTPGSPESTVATLGGGPAIGTSPVLDRDIFSTLKNICAENNIPYSVEVMPRRTYTNSEAFAIAKTGARVGMISLPLRYMHTPAEVCDDRDLEACAQLAAAYARSL